MSNLTKPLLAFLSFLASIFSAIVLAVVYPLTCSGFWFGDSLKKRRAVAVRISSLAKTLTATPTDKLAVIEFHAALFSKYAFERCYALHTLGNILCDSDSSPKLATKGSGKIVLGPGGEAVAVLGGELKVNVTASGSGTVRISTGDLDGLLVACIDGLYHADPFVRAAAAQTLSRVGSQAAFATTELVLTLNRYPHESSGMYAAIALGKVRPIPRHVEAALIQAASSSALANAAAKEALRTRTAVEDPQQSEIAKTPETRPQ